MLAVVVASPIGPVLSSAGDAPGALARRILSGDGATQSSRDRETAVDELSAHYSDVRTEVMRLLRAEQTRSSGSVAFGSPLHCAFQVASCWRIEEARDPLLRLLAVRLEPMTAPAGWCGTGDSTFHPAALALSSLSPRVESLIAEVPEEHLAIATWVAAESHGKASTAALLRHYGSLGRRDAPRFKRALELLESKEHVGDLLPRVVGCSGGK